MKGGKRETRCGVHAIAAGRIAFVGPDAAHCTGPETDVIEANGRFMLPGLCDAHMHIESGMLTPAEFARAVIPHGTTSMFTDPHEIANVLGLPGVRYMHDEALLQPINIFTQMPSCAPSAPGLETTGFEISAEDVAEAMAWPGIIGLGEMMNFPGVINGDPQMLAEMAATMTAGKTVGGHYASPDKGIAFSAYVAGGAADDHEGTAEAGEFLNFTGQQTVSVRANNAAGLNLTVNNMPQGVLGARGELFDYTFTLSGNALPVTPSGGIPSGDTEMTVLVTATAPATTILKPPAASPTLAARHAV